MKLILLTFFSLISIYLFSQTVLPPEIWEYKEGIPNQLPKGHRISANRDSIWEGYVAISVKEFKGFNPYSVPIQIYANGDVKTLYINNEKVNFKIGEKSFVRVNMNLYGGYNEVVVKVIGKSGKTREKSISIIIE